VDTDTDEQTRESWRGTFDVPDLAALRARTGWKWNRYGGDALPAWLADMDFAVAEPIRAALTRLIDTGDLGYPNWPAGTPLRAAFEARMAERFGWTPRPGRVREFTDVVQALQAVLHLHTDPGDGVALLTPSYPPFLASITGAGRTLVPVPMVPDGSGWAFDPDRLAGDLAATRCRVLALVNPHNPTGRVLRRNELAALAELALRHDLLVVSDEIHADLVYPPAVHVPFASLGPEVEDRTVTLTSATKAFNLAGVRCAVGHLGPARLREQFAALPTELLGAVSSPGVVATLAAWQECDGWLAGVLRYLDGNRALIAELLDGTGIGYRVPEATYLAWLDFRGVYDTPDPAELISLRGVELSHGPNFGPGSDGHARLNFATPRELLTTMLLRVVGR
jgi:cysteine-S-conjugate beta-lyase